MFLMNPTAALIWRGLADGLSPVDVVDALTSVADRPRIDVARECSALISDWRRRGLLADGARAAQRRSSRPEPLAPAANPTAAVDPSSFRPVVARTYRCVDFAFRLRTADGPADRAVHEFLDHLRVADQEGAPLSKWDLFFHDGQWLLWQDGRLLDACPPDGLLPMVHGYLMLSTYRGSECLLALHSAAVFLGPHCMLLAGVPGSGKSTLTAALLASGFGYCADDTVLLTRPPIRVRGIPLRVGLKPGSWAVVNELWPELEDASAYDRADGKRVRYLLPRQAIRPDFSQDARVADILVFPRYEAGRDTSLRGIRRAEALVKLTEAGYDAPRLNRETVAALVDWMAGIDCYELHYGDLREATGRLAALAS
jgi:hypothetical protein